MWTDHVENPQAIRSIFEQEPSLASVQLMKLELLWDGPTANLHIALHDYPTNPPQRWKNIAANAATLVLQLMGISHVSLDGWDTQNAVSCQIERQSESEYTITINGPSTKMTVTCVAIRIAHIEGYKRISQ